MPTSSATCCSKILEDFVEDRELIAFLANGWRKTTEGKNEFEECFDDGYFVDDLDGVFAAVAGGAFGVDCFAAAAAETLVGCGGCRLC